MDNSFSKRSMQYEPKLIFVKEYLSFRPAVLVKLNPIFIPTVNIFFSKYLAA